MKLKRKAALISGVALILMAATAAFTYGYLHNKLVIPGDIKSTIGNLQKSRLLFISEISGLLFILFLDVFVAWSLYVFFEKENPKLSLFTAGLRTVYAVILGVAIYHLILVLKIINESLMVAPDIENLQIWSNLNFFENVWSFGLIVFGFHLLFLGILAFKSNYIPRIWVILLVFAGVFYSLIHSAKIIFPEFEGKMKTAEMILSAPMALGEIGFAFWLIFRGGKPKIIFRNSVENR